MKNLIACAGLVLIVCTIISCKSEVRDKENQIQKAMDSDTLVESVQDVLLTKEYEPSDDELLEFGMLETITDGPYPFFVVTVNFVERNTKQDFNLNIEAISLDATELTQLEGKWAMLYYTSELENNLYDLHFNGASVFGENAPESLPDAKQITGILSGATQVTTGDLPDSVSITDADGNRTDFQLYIDESMLKVNDKEVSVYYYVRGVNTITHIRPSEEE